MGATSVVNDHTVSAVLRFAGPNTLMRRAWLPGIIGPDTAPCSTRKAINDGRLHASPHRSDAIVNNATDTTNVRTTPKRCMSQPVKGTDTPLATANEVITQVPWSELTPRSPLIVGMDTFAIEVSSTCMKVPSAKATAVTALAVPESVGASRAMAGFALTGLRPPKRSARGRRRH